MDDITKTQQSFARKAQAHPEHQFQDVYHLLCREEWITFALHHVLGNKGSRTPGIDGVTKRRFEDEAYRARFLTELRTALKEGTYRPDPVKRVQIPKPNGQRRPLGIATVRDRVVQMLLKMLLEPIWESDFLECSSGFRPTRRTMDSIAMCYQLIQKQQKFYWVVEGDISGCFDHVQRTRLLNLIKRRIQDQRVLRLIEAFLTAGIMEGTLYQETTEGVPQGGLFSPLLANIYLHELDKYWWEHYGQLDRNERDRRRKRKVGNCRLIRYADDFVILTNGPKAEAYRLREEFKTFLKNELDLDLNEAKTKITHAAEGFDFLGYQVRRYENPRQHTKPVTLVKPSQKSVQRLKAKIRWMTNHTHAPDNPYLKLMAVNAVLRGWGNYYQHVNAKAVLHTLDWWANDRLLRWLMDHHRQGVRATLKRYQRLQGTRKNLAVDNPQGERVYLYLMSDRPITRYPVQTKPNPYLGSWATRSETAAEQPSLDPDHTWNGSQLHLGWKEAKTARLHYDEHRCTECGSTERLEVHHGTPRRWSRRRQGNEALENLRTLCDDCHNKVHQSKREDKGNGAP